MAIDRNLEAALQKAVASLELKTSGTHLPELGGASSEVLWKLLETPDDRRFFAVMELLSRGLPSARYTRKRKSITISFMCFLISFNWKTS